MKLWMTARIRHGILVGFLQRKGWNQAELSRRSGVDAAFIGLLVNLRFDKLPKDPHASRRLLLVVVATGLAVDELIPPELVGKSIKTKQDATIEVDTSRVLEAAGDLHHALPPSHQDAVENQDEIEMMLSRLSSEQRFVVRRRFAVGAKYGTLAEIGADLGKSHERVRQIEWGALDRLRRFAGEALPIQVDEVI